MVTVAATSLVMGIARAIVAGEVRALLPALVAATLVAFVLHATLRGKFLVWAQLLDKLRLEGHERILDLGCGRGAVLLMAAQHLTAGRAVGVDLWRSVDQSGDSAEATRHYQEHLAMIGMSQVARSRLGWQSWWGGPWAAPYLVTVTKPERGT